MKSKFIIIFLCFWIALNNLSFASETISKPISAFTKHEKVQKEVKNKFTGAASPLNQIKEKSKTSSAQESTQKNQKLTFKDLLFRMFKALLGILVLILTFVVMIVIYKKLKTGSVSRQQVKQEEPSHFPSTISEAVSSFVKHRLDKRR